MKMTTEPAALAAAVKFAARALTARAAYPILGGLKITAADRGVEWPRSITKPPPGPASPPTWASPAPSFRRAACWPPSPLNCPASPWNWPSDGPALTLMAGPPGTPCACCQPVTTRAADYLPRPGRPTPAEFSAAVRQVVVAASRDDTLPALCTVQVTFTAEAFTLVATDRYRAALRELPWQPAGDQLPPPVLIPAPALADVARDTGGRTRSGCTC